MFRPKISVYWWRFHKHNLSKADICLERTKILVPKVSALDRFHCNLLYRAYFSTDQEKLSKKQSCRSISVHDIRDTIKSWSYLWKRCKDDAILLWLMRFSYEVICTCESLKNSQDVEFLCHVQDQKFLSNKKADAHFPIILRTSPLSLSHLTFCISGEKVLIWFSIAF